MWSSFGFEFLSYMVSQKLGSTPFYFDWFNFEGEEGEWMVILMLGSI